MAYLIPASSLTTRAAVTCSLVAAWAAGICRRSLGALAQLTEKCHRTGTQASFQLPAAASGHQEKRARAGGLVSSLLLRRHHLPVHMQQRCQASSGKPRVDLLPLCDLRAGLAACCQEMAASCQKERSQTHPSCCHEVYPELSSASLKPSTRTGPAARGLCFYGSLRPSKFVSVQSKAHALHAGAMRQEIWQPSLPPLTLGHCPCSSDCKGLCLTSNLPVFVSGF
jgi:hypothetical protein